MRVCIRLGRRRPLWQLGSPTIAGRCTNCCHSTYRRRVGHHPGNVGGPRIYESVLLSDGVETTVSCRAIKRPSGGLKPPIGKSKNDQILLANSKVLGFVYPTCLLGRQ